MLPVAPKHAGGEWLMNKVTQRAGIIQEAKPDGPVRAAENVLRDFETLLAILNRRCGDTTASNRPDQSRFAEARLAAARGVELSHQLIELLRSQH
jgi:hypothetical protein